MEVSAHHHWDAALVDHHHNPRDGGFCVVPGPSHKTTLKCPRDSEFIQQPATKAKAWDVMMFSEGEEGTFHGAHGYGRQSVVQRYCAYRFVLVDMADRTFHFQQMGGRRYASALSCSCCHHSHSIDIHIFFNHFHNNIYILNS